MSTSLSTHVLDAATGRPAPDMLVSVRRDGVEIASAATDSDGRIAELGAALEPGTLDVVFATGPWFAARDTPTFYPSVTLTVTVEPADQHLHVPLLLSPFAYSTYRGS